MVGKPIGYKDMFVNPKNSGVGGDMPIVGVGVKLNRSTKEIIVTAPIDIDQNRVVELPVKSEAEVLDQTGLFKLFGHPMSGLGALAASESVQKKIGLRSLDNYKNEEPEFLSIEKHENYFDIVEWGSMRANFGLIYNMNGSDFFSIHPIVGAKEVMCYFDKSLLEKIEAADARYVEVSGKIFTRQTDRYPYKIEVTDIEILPREEELPKLSEMGGSLPEGFFGGKSVEEYLEDMRDDWD